MAPGGVGREAPLIRGTSRNERLRLQNSPGSAARHVAVAVALGAFGLAVGANMHSLSAGSTNQHRQLRF
ncbi:MAG: hypothetical protein IPJ07_19215 [Acidobacteria bacterium]|nr:hypothetical protein [Acidobacteriota bacterium]